MGASWSRASDNRTPVVTVTATPAGSYRPSVTNNWSTFPESRASPVAHAGSYIPSVTNKALSESRAPPPPAAPVLAPNPKSHSTNRMIAFHSDASWRTYFEASKGSNKLILIDFTATWCGPCRYMEPILNEFAAKYTDVDFVKIDVDELFNVSRKYGVQAMPTFLFIKRGIEVDKVVGTRKEELQRKIEKHMA